MLAAPDFMSHPEWFTEVWEIENDDDDIRTLVGYEPTPEAPRKAVKEMKEYSTLLKVMAARRIPKYATDPDVLAWVEKEGLTEEWEDGVYIDF